MPTNKTVDKRIFFFKHVGKIQNAIDTGNTNNVPSRLAFSQRHKKAAFERKKKKTRTSTTRTNIDEEQKENRATSIYQQQLRIILKK